MNPLSPEISRHPSAVRKWIRDAAADLSRLPYNWDGKGGLPIRDDVLRLIEGYLATDESRTFGGSEARPILNAFANVLPVVQLEVNGTTTVIFKVERRRLRLRCLCHRTISYLQLFDDGRTQISGMLECKPGPDRETLRELLRWLKEGK